MPVSYTHLDVYKRQTLPNAVEVEKKRDKAARRIQETMNEDSESALTDAKYGFISGALKETFTDNHLEQEQTTKVLDSIVTHRIWGYPIFFLFMYLMFEGTFVIGEYPVSYTHLVTDKLVLRNLLFHCINGFLQIGSMIDMNMAEHFTHRFFAMGIISRMFTMVFKIG